MLGRVISSSDGHYIPINIPILLNLENVIKVYKSKEVNENSLATNE